MEPSDVPVVMEQAFEALFKQSSGLDVLWNVLLTRPDKVLAAEQAVDCKIRLNWVSANLCWRLLVSRSCQIIQRSHPGTTASYSPGVTARGSVIMSSLNNENLGHYDLRVSLCVSSHSGADAAK
jgi:hypothetical protein